MTTTDRVCTTCGHSVVSSDEGTGYCPECERRARACKTCGGYPNAIYSESPGDCPTCHGTGVQPETCPTTEEAESE